MKSTQKQVWDIAIRLFHWALVISFITSYLTGDEESLVHAYSGYLIIGLLCFRVIWGLVGSKHARFSDFMYSPKHVFDYAKSMFSGHVDHIDGHNPLGGLMVFALLICLALTTASGLKVYGLEGHGPLAKQSTSLFISDAQASVPSVYGEDDDQHETEEHFWEEVHEFFVNVTIFLIILHIIGVIVSSRLEQQNLVKAMLTGYKELSSKKQ
jgi:cytochrome b